MKALFFVLSLLFFFDVSAKTSKIVFSDQAVFKVEEKVYLLSDIVKFNKSFSIFRCLLPHSMMLQVLDLDLKSLEIIPKYDGLRDLDLKEESLYLQRLLKLMKLNIFIGRQNITADQALITGLKPENCSATLGKFESWDKDLKSLFTLEAFWSDHFSANAYKLTEREIEAVKSKNPKELKADALKKILDEERGRFGRASFLELIKTVDKQISHELFY